MVLIGPEVLFALAAAVVWGFGAVIAKRGMIRGGNPFTVALLGAIFGTGIFWTALIISTGGDLTGRLTPTAVWMFTLSGLVGSALGRLCYYVSINNVGATIAEAVASTNPLFATVLALIIIGEPVLPLEFVGMLVIVVGLVIVSLSKGGDVTGWELRDLFFPLLTGIAFGAGQMLRRYGFVLTDATPIEGTALNASAALVGVVAFLAVYTSPNTLRPPRQALGYVLVAALIAPLGLLISMVALELGRVVVVVPIIGTLPLFVLAFSYLFLDDVERITRGTFVGIVCIVAGIALLTSV